MRNIADCKSAMEVQVKASQMLERFEKHTDYYDEGGQYLPLSVWDGKGFNVDSIERFSKPEDKMNHDVLGPCYRVKILEKGSQGERGHFRRENWQTVDPPSCAAPSVPVAAPAENNDAKNLQLKRRRRL